MAPEQLLEKFQTFKTNDIIYHFKARGLKISEYVIIFPKYLNFAILWTL